MQENTKNILSINARIMQVLDYYNDTRYKFSKKSGISESVLLNISKGSNKPGYDFILKLLNIYEAVNARWLITGVGSMLSIEKGSNNAKEARNEYLSSCKLCLEKDQTINALKEANSALHLAIDKMSAQEKGKVNYKQTG